MSMMMDAMVGAMRSLGTAPLFTPADLAIIAASMADFDERGQTMARAWKAYYGKFPDALRVRRDGVNDNIKVNRIRPLVNATVFFLWGKPPALDLPDPPGVPDGGDPVIDAWEKLLLATLAANGWESLLLDTGTNGAVGGDYYWRFVPPASDGDLPHIHNLDPALCSIITHPRDISDERGYVWQYNSVDARGRPATYRVTFLQEQLADGARGQWLITEEVNTSSSGQGWRLTGPPTVWEWPWCPILHAKNLPNPNSPYGVPDVTDDLIDLNKSENALLSNQNRIIRLHAHPKVWVRGMGGNKVDFAVDEVINIPSPQGEIGQLVPAVTGEAAGNLGRVLNEATSEMSQTPSITLGRADQAGDPSGVAIELKFGPLVQKTHVKRALAGPFLVEACRRLLEMLGYGPEGRVTLAWKAVLPTDLAKIAPALNMGVLAGYISKKSAAGKWGLDWAEEQTNLAAEAVPLAQALKDVPRGAGGSNTPPVDTAPEAEETPLDAEAR